MDTDHYLDEFQAAHDVLEIFRKINPEDRPRILKTVQTFLEIKPEQNALVNLESSNGKNNENCSVNQFFSEDRSMSPKEFLMQKKPITDAERVACLAFYLTHYCDTPYFKTLDVSKLNMEAAQIKFSNAAVAVNNATRDGLLVSATKGHKQLSAHGEMFVQALPDRDAAKDVLKELKPRKRSNSKNKTKKTP